MDASLVIAVIVCIIFVAALFFCIYMLISTMGFFARKKFPCDGTKSDAYVAGTLLMLGDMSASDKLDEIELHDVSMRLNKDEACYFEGVGFSYQTKEVVSGYRQSSRGRSVHIMRGYSVHSSDGKSDVIRQTVKTEYPGRLFVTNERIVFLAERYGFDIAYDKLSNISIYNGYIEVFSGSKFYRVYTLDTVFIRDLITLMNICHEERYIQN